MGVVQSAKRFGAGERVSPPAADAGWRPADPGVFREAMREFASSVSIVTVGSGNDRNGLTATAVASLSAEPPSLLVCVNRNASSYPAFRERASFAVNVLAADQRALASRFAGAARGEERFREGRWVELSSGVSVLADAVAVLECQVDSIIERHTHAIIIGSVRGVVVGAGAGALVYWRGGYDQIGWSRDEISRATGE